MFLKGLDSLIIIYTLSRCLCLHRSVVYSTGMPESLACTYHILVKYMSLGVQVLSVPTEGSLGDVWNSEHLSLFVLFPDSL